MTSKILLPVVVLLFVLLPGCDEERHETPTKGRVTVAVAEEVAPVIRIEQSKFQELYDQARVELQIAATREAIARYFNDSIKVVVSARPMNPEERDVAKKFNIVDAAYKIAIDALAIVVNEENSITRLQTTRLDSIFSGRVTNWKDAGGTPGAIELCLPSRNSGDYEVVQQKVLHGGNFAMAKNTSATSGDVLRYISQHPHSIGFVGLNWIGNKPANVRVLEISDPSVPDSLGIKGQYFAPFQAHVYRGYYPLTRDVYIYSRADNYGVAAGFISFITSAPGQKIIVNSGLVPATMPVRLVQLTNNNLSQ